MPSGCSRSIWPTTRRPGRSGKRPRSCAATRASPSSARCCANRASTSCRNCSTSCAATWSCVGPRPVVADELQRYGPFAADYLRTRPGLTGLWQVTGRNATDYSAPRLPRQPICPQLAAVVLDIIILWRTVFAVMRFDQTVPEPCCQDPRGRRSVAGRALPAAARADRLPAAPTPGSTLPTARSAETWRRGCRSIAAPEPSRRSS